MPPAPCCCTLATSRHAMKRRPAVCCIFLALGLAAAAAAATAEAEAATAEPAAAGVEPFTLAPGSGLKWVQAADTREGHAAACLRNGLDPTPSEVLLSDQVLPALESAAPTDDDAAATTPLNSSTAAAAPPPPPQPLWSEAILSLVASGLGLELERPGGVAGCCVPGMWCGPRGCYTLAFGGTFSNHGGYVGIPADEYSIFTCVEPSVPLAAPPANSSAAPTAASDSDGSPAAEGPVDNNNSNNNNATAISAESDNSGSSSRSSGSDGSASALPTLPPAEQPTATVGHVENGSPPAAPARPTIDSVSPGVARAGEALMVVGTGFGEAVEDVRVMVGGRDCRDPELCHLVCRPCSDEDRCEFDEMCMEDGLSKEKVCLPICDGTEGSCPCDHRCMPKRFELQGEPHSMVVNLCRPPDADPNFLCHGSALREQERIQCTVPVLVWDQAETESSDNAGQGLGAPPAPARSRGTDGYGGDEIERDHAAGAGRRRLLDDGGGEEGVLPAAAGVSLSVGGRGAVWEGEGVEYAPRACESMEDCDDGDACSFDACVEGKCVHTGVQEGYGCQAQPAGATWRADAYRYFQVVGRGDPAEQAEFVAEVQAQNRLSSVTFADDYPVERHTGWGEFPVYGTKYEDIFISPNGALLLQTVTTGGLSAVSPSTEAFFPVLKADWNPSDRRAASAVLLMIDDDQFSVLYEDVFLFKRSALATPSTFSTTVFPDGSLRYRYIRIGDRADWTVGVSGNSFVSPTIRNRHVRQAEFIQTDEDGLPVTSAAAAAAAAAASQVIPGGGTSTPSAPSSALNATDADGGSPDGPEDISGDATSTTTSTTTASNGDDNDDDDQKEDDDGGGGGGGGSGGDAGTEVTLCRAPTLACLGRACGKAGSEVFVLWEGFACRAAAAMNVSFACRIGGLEVPAVSLDGSSSSSSAGAGLDLDWTGVAGGDREEAWGPDWIGAGSGGLVCEVPRLEWAEEGQEPAVMVPVEVVWFSTGQASASAQRQVSQGAADVAVRGLSVMGDAGVVNSHVLTFRYFREDAEAPNCGCSPVPRQADLACDSCLVCGGDDSTKDCGGFCHGEAYVSPCGKCAGGMTGVEGDLYCDEYREYLDGPAQAALLSLSQSIMMLVALSIMTAFLMTCLFLARALMLRGVLAVEGDRHGTLRRRVFSRHRGLSPWELECLETFEYSAVGLAPSEANGDDEISYTEVVGAGDIELRGEHSSVSVRGAGSERVGDEVNGGGAGVGVGSRADDEASGSGGGGGEAGCSDCAICLGGFEEADVLRKLPCRHFFHQECVDEWLHLSVSCPLCKRSAREGLRRHRRRRRRARAVAQRASRDSVSASAVPAPAPATTSTASTSSAVSWARGLPSSLSRVFARDANGGGGGVRVGRGRRQWQQLGSADPLDGDDGDVDGDVDGDALEELDDDGSSSPPLDGEEEEDGSGGGGGRRRRVRVADAQLAAFFGVAEPTPRVVAPASLGGGAGGNNIVGTALEALFGGRGRGRAGGVPREGERRGGRAAVARTEYELAPVGPAAGVGEVSVRNADAV